MILDFSISNFRSIREEQTLSFEATKDSHLEDFYVVKKGPYRILKIASILGANASGKSNMLRAFFMIPRLMMQPCETKVSRIVYDKFGLDRQYTDKDTHMTLNFIVGEKKYHYEVKFNNTAVTSEVLLCHPFDSLRAHKIYERSTDLSNMTSSFKWGDNYRSAVNTRILQGNLLHNRTLFGAFLYSNVDIVWMREILDWVDSYILPIVNTDEQHLTEFTSDQIIEKQVPLQHVVDLLKYADVGVESLLLEQETQELPKEIVNLMLLRDDIPTEVRQQLQDDPHTTKVHVKMAHKGADGEVFFDFQNESAGTQRYYGLSSILLRMIQEPHFLAFDELENKLHPDLYWHFILTFLMNAKESQMIYTTHYREFLNDRDSFRDDSVWFAEKNEQGATELFSLADFGSDILRDSTNRYNAYRIGKLGALPRLGNKIIS